MKPYRTLLSWVMAAACMILAYATFIEPRNVTTANVEFRGGPLASLLDGSTVALVSDLHFDDSGESLAGPVLGILRESKPDLILLLGDFVAWGSRGTSYERALDFLGALEAPLGMYAVMGDADSTRSRKSCGFCHEAGGDTPTKRHRVQFLRNSERTIELKRGTLRIVGFDAVHPPDSPARIRGFLSGDAPTILLSHSSVGYRDIPPDTDVLMISGDTHGGQVHLPSWFWRLTRLKPDPDHLHGLFRDGARALYVTSGIGTSRLPVRLGRPPEIALLKFTAAP